MTKRKETTDSATVKKTSFRATMTQIMRAKTETKSENREPTRAKLNQKFKLVKRQ